MKRDKEAERILPWDKSKWGKVEEYLIGLNDRDRRVRRRSAQTLGYMRNVIAVEPLIKALEDDDSTVRGAAAEALALIRDARAIQPLIEAFVKDKDGMRFSGSQLIWALSKFKEEVIKPLIAVLPDMDNKLRERALDVFYGLSDIAIDPLLKLLQGINDNDFRQQLILTLGQIGDEDLIPVLEKIIEEDDNSPTYWELIDAAKEAIATIKEPKESDIEE